MHLERAWETTDNLYAGQKLIDKNTCDFRSKQYDLAKSVEVPKLKQGTFYFTEHEHDTGPVKLEEE